MKTRVRQCVFQRRPIRVDILQGVLDRSHVQGSKPREMTEWILLRVFGGLPSELNAL